MSTGNRRQTDRPGPTGGPTRGGPPKKTSICIADKKKVDFPTVAKEKIIHM